MDGFKSISSRLPAFFIIIFFIPGYASVGDARKEAAAWVPGVLGGPSCLSLHILCNGVWHNYGGKECGDSQAHLLEDETLLTFSRITSVKRP